MNNNPQVIMISKDSIEEKIKEYLLYGFSDKCHFKIECETIKQIVPKIRKECHLSLPETYVYLGQYPSAYLYGLYKCEINNVNYIYIIKSFMDTVLHAVPFNRKYFE